MTEDEPTNPAPTERSVLDWRALKNTPAWLFNGAAAGNRWEVSAQAEATAITEAEYDAALTRAAGRQ